MAIQDLKNENELVRLYESFENLRDNYNNAKSMLKNAISQLKDNSLYAGQASIEEKKDIDNYYGLIK